jgi:hypothetical protein
MPLQAWAQLQGLNGKSLGDRPWAARLIHWNSPDGDDRIRTIKPCDSQGHDENHCGFDRDRLTVLPYANSPDS